MRFPGHETVSIGNRVRVNVALVDPSVLYHTFLLGPARLLPYV